jgi:hypothetical protein
LFLFKDKFVSNSSFFLIQNTITWIIDFSLVLKKETFLNIKDRIRSFNLRRRLSCYFLHFLFYNIRYFEIFQMCFFLLVIVNLIFFINLCYLKFSFSINSIEINLCQYVFLKHFIPNNSPFFRSIGYSHGWSVFFGWLNKKLFLIN